MQTLINESPCQENKWKICFNGVIHGIDAIQFPISSCSFSSKRNRTVLKQLKEILILKMAIIAIQSDSSTTQSLSTGQN